MQPRQVAPIADRCSFGAAPPPRQAADLEPIKNRCHTHAPLPAACQLPGFSTGSAASSAGSLSAS